MYDRPQPTKSAAELNEETKSLPVALVESELQSEIASNDTVIIVGETGSGKTTQVPRQLLRAGYARGGMRIGVTQPRRVAAMTVAQRVAAEEGCRLGEKVGYAIRFDDTTSHSTRIKYMTDGILMREAMSDPKLARYSVIIVDEAHERTLMADVLLALLKGIQARRQGTSMPLKLVVMSATLHAESFATYFGNARVLFVPGRRHQVELLYTQEPQPDYLDAAVVSAGCRQAADAAAGHRHPDPLGGGSRRRACIPHRVIDHTRRAPHRVLIEIVSAAKRKLRRLSACSRSATQCCQPMLPLWCAPARG